MVQLQLTALILFLFLSGCQSESPVLKPAPVDQPVATPEEAPPVPTPRSPAYERLERLLFQLGYQPMGLEHESEATLVYLEKVFSNPRAKGRAIRMLYTGAKTAYDAPAESLTLKPGSVEAALQFLTDKVPLRRP